MSQSNPSPAPGLSCDYLIIGGGSAGAVLAARLSEQSQKQVVLVEAGPTASSVWVKIPLGVGKLILGNQYLWPFWTTKQQAMKGQKIYWPRGKALGGSSTVNGMLWTRGDARAYERMAEYGGETWSWPSVLPYFKKCERFETGDPALRGHDGPVGVCEVLADDPLTRAFMSACEQQGFAKNADFNDGQHAGVSHLQFSIDRGQRCSTYDAYLKPILSRPNLRILTETVAHRVLFDGTRACGAVVEQRGELLEIKASAETILCAGTLKSPQLLELSGIGDAEHLGSLGIPVIHDQKAVGENLTDHVNMRATYRTNQAVTVNDIMNSKRRGLLEGLKYLATRKGLLGFSTVTTHAIRQLDPDQWSSTIKLQLSLISGADRYSSSSDAGLDPYSGFNIGSFQVYPKSRGFAHIQSIDPHSDPLMSANYFTDDYDRALIVDQMRSIKQLAQSDALAPLIEAETRPDIDVRDDAALIDYVLETAQTCWHPVGTCAMGSDERAVVDCELRVNGTQDLRVVDASVFPEITATNTNAPTIMLAEKVADLIRA